MCLDTGKLRRDFPIFTRSPGLSLAVVRRSGCRFFAGRKPSHETESDLSVDRRRSADGGRGNEYAA